MTVGSHYKDLYKVLGVGESAPPDEIKRAYRKLARKYHPDVSKADNAEEKFKEVAEAYEVLKDPERRAAYDQLRVAYKSGSTFRGAPGGGAGIDLGELFRNMGGSPGSAGPGGAGLGDIFDNLFRGGGPAPQPPPAKGRDIAADVTVPLETAYRGGTVRVRLQSVNADKPRALDVKIPAGVTQGQKIRLQGQGGPGPAGAGDLIVTIALARHGEFEVDGRNIRSKLVVTPWEAALGAKIQAATLAGGVEVNLPPGTQSGAKLRLKGKGLPTTPAGDHILEIAIHTPPADTPEAKAIYARMQEELEFRPRQKGPKA